MAGFTNIATPIGGQTSSLPLGLLIQIAFSNGIRNQISTDFRDYEMVKRAKVANSLARELRFMFQTSLGAAAIQYADPSAANHEFPEEQYVNLEENSAVLKRLEATIELPYEIYDRARKNPEKYGEPLQIELESKMSSAKRRLAADLYGDGTGVVGTAASVSGSVAALGDQITVTLATGASARGHVGFFEYQDLYIARKPNGTASTAATSIWKAVDKVRENNQVVLQLVSGTVAAPDATDVFYRKGQPRDGSGNFPNLTGSVVGVEYGTISPVIAGLASLTANDGRKVHGITMSGVTGGTHLDAGGNPLDVKHIQKLMSKVKIGVGQDRYRWKMLTMAPESHATLIESRETDRRFQTVEDNKRGVKYFAYIHGNDVLECTESEFVPQDKIYCLPETKGGEKVIEFHGSDFETVKGQDLSDWHMKVSGGSYRSAMVSYLTATGVLICKHPQSIGVIDNFTNT